MPSLIKTSGLVFSVLAAYPALAAAQDRPHLILQITVDQLRGDMLTRHLDQLGAGGFRYLLEEGIHYDNAHHTHANTETIVGHTTLATGATLTCPRVWYHSLV